MCEILVEPYQEVRKGLPQEVPHHRWPTDEDEDEDDIIVSYLY